jgi:pimeloyl-ACP methyl ester carboxylesterase
VSAPHFCVRIQLRAVDLTSPACDGAGVVGSRAFAARLGGLVRTLRSFASFAVSKRAPSQYVDGAFASVSPSVSPSVSIHFTDEGPRDGEPVVLIHGFAVNANLNWRLPGVTAALARDFRVISMDLRGHGRSGKPHDDSRYGPHMADDVIRLLDHLNIERAHVIGYSLGGFVALKLAASASASERLRSASVLGAGWEPPDNSEFLEALPRLADQLEAGRGVGPLMGNLGAGRSKPGLLHQVWVKLMTRYFNDQRALIGVIRSAPELAVTGAELEAIRIPVCSIVGSADPLLVAVDAMRGRVLDHTITVVNGADHLGAPMRAEFHQGLRQFLLGH